jgi:hypothetical protein
MLKIALLPILVISACFADDDLTHTDGAVNGRGWQSASNSFKTGYVVGFQDTLNGLGSKESSTLLPKNMTVGDAIRAIDIFYEERENRAIPIIGAISVVTAKANGMSPTELEQFKANLRRSFADSKGK